MFETALLRKHGSGFSGVDAGLIAETMLFYSDVHLIVQFGVLCELLRTIGPELLVRLAEERALKVTFLRTDFMTMTANSGGVEFHGFASGHLSSTATAPRDGRRRKVSPVDAVHLAFERTLGNSWSTKRFCKRFLDAAKVQSDSAFMTDAKNICEQANSDLEIKEYILPAILASISEFAPGLTLPQDTRFDITQSSKGFIISHNIDFASLDSHFKRNNPAADALITPALLVNQIVEAQADLWFSSNYMAELVTNSASAAVARRRLAMLMRKRDRNSSQIGTFLETQLGTARAVREAINSGEYSFGKFIKIYEKGKKFRSWLHDRHPDANLLDEYYRSIYSASWIDRLPGKICRLFASVGVSLATVQSPIEVGLAANIGFGVLDQFIFGRLISGWKPNQFVAGPLQRFRT